MIVVEEALTNCDLWLDHSEPESGKDSFSRALALCSFLRKKAAETPPSKFLDLNGFQKEQLDLQSMRNEAYYLNETARILEVWCRDYNPSLFRVTQQARRDNVNRPHLFVENILKFPMTQGKRFELQEFLTTLPKSHCGPHAVHKDRQHIDELLCGRTTLADILKDLDHQFKIIHVINPVGFIDKSYTVQEYAIKFKSPYIFLDQQDWQKEDTFLTWPDASLQKLYSFTEQHPQDIIHSKQVLSFLKNLGYLENQRVIFQPGSDFNWLPAAQIQIQTLRPRILGDQLPPTVSEARDFLYRALEFGSQELIDYLHATLSPTKN